MSQPVEEHNSLPDNTYADTLVSVAHQLLNDPEFARLAAVWPSLPANIKAAILTLIGAAD